MKEKACLTIHPLETTEEDTLSVDNKDNFRIPILTQGQDNIKFKKILLSLIACNIKLVTAREA